MLKGSGDRPRSRWRRARRVAAGGVGVVVVAAGVVIVPALTAPGNDGPTARIAESARDHGLGFIVTGLESLQYRLSPPKQGGTLDPRDAQVLAEQTDPAASPSARPSSSSSSSPSAPTASPRAHQGSPPRSSSGPSGSAPGTGAVIGLQPALTPVVTPALPGEGRFEPRVIVNGQPAVQVALLRPDQQHTSYLSAVAWMSGRLLRVVQHPGSTDPGGAGRFTQPATIAPSARLGLVASFNSGFKIADARGAFYQDGVTVGRFRDGAASLVVDDTGQTSIGAWGRDVSMNPHVVSVRQNLDLLVDGGQLSPKINGDTLGPWGATVHNATFVWRSGIGITADGDLVFAAGDALSASSLATLLQRAGAVRAMELDINKAWVSFMWYSPAPAGGSSPVPHKLLDYSRPADRYYAINNRDFFAVYAR